MPVLAVLAACAAILITKCLPDCGVKTGLDDSDSTVDPQARAHFLVASGVPGDELVGTVARWLPLWDQLRYRRATEQLLSELSTRGTGGVELLRQLASECALSPDPEATEDSVISHITVGASQLTDQDKRALFGAYFAPAVIHSLADAAVVVGCCDATRSASDVSECLNGSPDPRVRQFLIRNAFLLGDWDVSLKLLDVAFGEFPLDVPSAVVVLVGFHPQARPAAVRTLVTLASRRPLPSETVLRGLLKALLCLDSAAVLALDDVYSSSTISPRLRELYESQLAEALSRREFQPVRRP